MTPPRRGKDGSTAFGAPARLGVGLGLRSAHYRDILQGRPAVPWFEAISENYMGLRGGSGGRPLEVLEQVRARRPVILHGVSLNIGSVDPLDRSYLRRLRALADRVEPLWMSDHLCWTGSSAHSLHDLLPLPYDEATLRHLESRVGQVQDALGRPLLLENVSSYLSWRHSTMSEWTFLAELARRTGCGLLLDVNNVYVSAVNHGFDPKAYLRALDPRAVGQMHLAGHRRQGALLIDTHDQPVPDPVWELYGEALRLFGPVPTLIEWDDRIPSFARLVQEARKAERLIEAVLKEETLAPQAALAR